MSTRGIMAMEVEMPEPDSESKKRGRVYVCDLAGTEPAGDIVYALCNNITFEDGTFEYQFTGPHADMKKTKELQEQGKKINLSLSEMAQFFMKMAEAVIKKKLTPGMSIPGCNSFFLCKYLKDTMLQARTYLFCAIRPEVESQIHIRHSRFCEECVCCEAGSKEGQHAALWFFFFFKKSFCYFTK
jgi:hypothetical protein